MAKTVCKIVLIFVPIFFVIGIIRMALHYDEGFDFVPRWSDWLGAMSTFPDFTGTIQGMVADFMVAGDNLATGWQEVTDLPSFFSAIGLFFQQVGQFFTIVGYVISIPFQTIGWFFVNLFNLTGNNTMNPPVL